MEWRYPCRKPAGNSVGLDAFDVVARPCVDFDLVSFVNEEGDIDRRAGLNFRGFRGSRCLVVAYTRRSLAQLQFDGDPDFKRNHFTPVEHDIDAFAFLEKASSFTHGFIRNADLVVCLLLHEDKAGPVVIEVLELLRVDPDRIDRFSGAEPRFDHLSGYQALELRTHEGTPVAGIHMLELDYRPQVSIHANRHARPKIRRRSHTSPGGEIGT